MAIRGELSLLPLVRQEAPELLDLLGVGPITAAQITPAKEANAASDRNRPG